MNKNHKVAAAVLLLGGLAACSSPEDPGRETFGPKPLFDPVVLPTNSAGSAIVPLPFDGLYGTDSNLADENAADPVDADNNLDGTLSLAGVIPAPGLGLADGWSTVAPLFFNLVGDIDVANAADGIRIFDSQRQVELQPGVDFTVTQSPVSIRSPRLLVHWLRPLNESTRYLVGITTDLKGPEGGAAIPGELFALLRSTTTFSEQGSSIQASLAARGEAGQVKIATLDALQQSLILPVVQGLIGLSGAAPSSRGAIAREDLVLAWSFTTQSVSPTLSRIAASAAPRALGVAPFPLNSAQLISGDPANPAPLPPGATADVFVGSFNLAYYHTPGADSINTSVWRNDGTLNNVTHPGLGAPCGAILPATSTTICYPDPAVQDELNVPVLLTRPQGSMPAGGWPVVVFLHGVTGDRSQMLGLSPALTRAGFVVIAIDQPLHGLPPGHPLRVPGTTERHFEADLNGDGMVDPSGSYFVNLASLMTGRDNLRQSAADQLSLIASLGNLNLDGDSVNTGRVHFVGHSLGGIVGATVLGNSDSLRASSLGMPGGGIAKLLDASDTFGPVVAGGLQAAAGIVKGTDSYEIFLRFAQLAVDPADPLNWAAAAASRDRAIHLIEVEGDTVVPNNALDSPNVIVVDFLGGTTPLAETLGLPLSTISPPLAETSLLAGSQHIRFTSGSHGSLLRPDEGDDASFTEMQRQVANFLASDGQCLPLGGNCPQPAR